MDIYGILFYIIFGSFTLLLFLKGLSEMTPSNRSRFLTWIKKYFLMIFFGLAANALAFEVIVLCVGIKNPMVGLLLLLGIVIFIGFMTWFLWIRSISIPPVYEEPGSFTFDKITKKK